MTWDIFHPARLKTLGYDSLAKPMTTYAAPSQGLTTYHADHPDHITQYDL